MDQKLDKKLCRLAPRLFIDRNSTIETTALCWGFECGDGWYNILEEASVKIEQLIFKWIGENPYKNEFPSWVFHKYKFPTSFQHRYYALWNWLQIAIGIRQPEPWWPRASQVKEKYGTLRFYMTSSTPEIDAIIYKAERQSAETCEICGKPGKWRDIGWSYVRCNSCRKKE